MRVLGIIPARGGSKGVPRKNIRPLCGLPLIGHVHAMARELEELSELVLTTDDQEIADIGRELGMHVPFIRPAELATDSASSLETVKHAIAQMEAISDTTYDAIVLLQPTCPLTQPHHVRTALRMLETDDLDAVGSATRLDETHPAFALERRGKKLERLFPEFAGMTSRHDLQPLYRACGNVYAYRRRNPMERDVLLGGDFDFVEIEKEFTVNINDEIDWAIAGALTARFGRRQGYNST
jgi:CMP-N,N'-diacetyllegionaminic acid synthase